MDFLTTAFVATVLIALILYICNKRPLKYPPGPFGLPYVGSFFSVNPASHLTFSKWAKKYGSVFSVKLGQVNAIVLNDASSIKEAFKEDAFSGRPANKFFLELAGGAKDGVIASEGQQWVDQRRFALRGMRDFGLGKLSMEALIMEEVDEFIERIKAEGAGGAPISLNRKFSLAILNTVWMITCGRRYEQDDPSLSKLFNTFSESFNSTFKSGFLVFFHDLCMWAPGYFGWNQFIKCLDETFAIMDQEISEHVVTHIPTNPPRDFLDLYLSAMASTTDPDSSFYPDPTVLVDFFGAGSETTAATLTWSVLYLATNPTAQKKMQAEIDRVVGVNRKPALADRASLPYTEAVVNEVLRLSTIVPTGVFHSTMTNVKFQGYEIPKDTYIIANLHGANHDSAVWDCPNEFRPERFLSADGSTVLKPDSFVPFSAGKRVCIGETLARNEVFLFMANVFHRFQVRPDRPAEQLSMEPQLGFLLQPQKFNVILKERFS